MPENPSSDQVVIHPRMERELRDRLHAYAKATRRSLNGAVVYLLEAGLAAEAAQTAPAEEPPTRPRPRAASWRAAR